MERSTIVGKLAGFGKAVDTSFDQGDRADRHLAKGQVDEGYCRGVALDWIRRTAQGGKLSYPETDFSRDQSRTLRMAVAYVNMSSFEESRAAIIKAGIDRYNALLNGKRKLGVLYNGNLGRPSVTLAADHTTFLNEQFTFAQPLPSEVPMTRLDAWIDSLTATMAEQDALITQMQKTTDLVGSWQQFTKALDEYFLKGRAQAQRHDSKKPFSGLETGESTEREPYPDFQSSTTTILSKLAAPWNAVLIGYGLKQRRVCTCSGGSGAKEADTGHAVAVLYTGESPHPYHLFDPNYGTYSYARDGVEKALAFLFDPREGGVYNSSSDFICDKKFRHSNGQTLWHTLGMRYTVFFPKNPPRQQPEPSARAAAAAAAMPAVLPPRTVAAPVVTQRPAAPMPTRAAQMPTPQPPAPAAPRTVALPPVQQSPPQGGSVGAAMNFWKALDGKM